MPTRMATNGTCRLRTPGCIAITWSARFNADVPLKQLVLEQIAGDLVEPRVDTATGLNESLIGPMAMRLGERRHGDNAEIEGVTQEAMTNVINTITKAYLGTTVACAQCHDHKLDAVGQKDYYALAGIFMSTRWGARPVDAVDPNVAVIDELRSIKQSIRGETARQWLDSKDALIAQLAAIAADEKAGATFPESIAALCQRWERSPISAADFREQRRHRIAENQANLTLLADFTAPTAPKAGAGRGSACGTDWCAMASR